MFLTFFDSPTNSILSLQLKGTEENTNLWKNFVFATTLQFLPLEGIPVLLYMSKMRTPRITSTE